MTGICVSCPVVLHRSYKAVPLPAVPEKSNNGRLGKSTKLFKNSRPALSMNSFNPVMSCSEDLFTEEKDSAVSQRPKPIPEEETGV
jgi:hypothetical protein